MSPPDGDRRLFWHGVLLFLLGLLMGGVVQSVASPRLGLAAHVGTVMNGTFVLALGALWSRLGLAASTGVLAFWCVVVGSYLGCTALFLAAVFGTSRSTPLLGAGHVGTPLQETLVNAGLTVGALALLVGCAIVLWGLRRPRAG
jgi:hydroxylaminobenzene mutase